MKRLSSLILALLAGALVMAQHYPADWSRLTSDAYYHDIESAATKQEALSRARINLAKQIQVRVEEVSTLNTQSVNGRSQVLYNSSKSFSTEVDMSLAESKSYYHEATARHYVIVFIHKAEACTFYENEVKMLISNAGNAVTIADNYIASGFKSKAKTELQQALPLFEQANKPFFWLNVFGLDRDVIQRYLSSLHQLEQAVRQRLADLEYGTTYCVVCRADLFGSRYSKLLNEVKGDLSASGCNFVDDAQSADYVIYIDAAARQYNEFQGAYFTYVDAAIAIDKNATGQRIFEDEVSAKGSHTLGYKEAARDGYKRIRNQITQILKDNIKL